MGGSGNLRHKVLCLRDGQRLHAGERKALVRVAEILAAEPATPDPSSFGAEPETAADGPVPADGNCAEFTWGVALAERKLYAEARECFQEALRTGHASYQIHYCLAGVCKGLGDPTSAQAHLRQCLAMNPAFVPAYLLLAAVLKAEGAWEPCIRLCRQALALDPGNAVGWYDLACYLALDGQCRESLLSLEMALGQGFSDPAYAMRDGDLVALHQYPEFWSLLGAGDGSRAAPAPDRAT